MMSIPLPDTAEYLSTQAGYDRWAEIYDGDENPLVAIEEPHVERLLGDVRGLNILDVGCGTGRHAFRLAASGAKVTAIDFSEGMLQKARAKPGAEAIRFQTHDLARPFPLADLAFDRVVCGLVLDHITELDHIFREMGRVCHPKGRIVVSIMHPAMMLRGVQARFQDPNSGQEVRPASCMHQLSDYVMAAVRAGLTLDHLSEHLMNEELANRSDRAKKYLGWPILFMMQLVI